MALEQLTHLHNCVEATKSSIALTQEVITTDMNSLIGKLDQAIN